MNPQARALRTAALILLGSLLVGLIVAAPVMQ